MPTLSQHQEHILNQIKNEISPDNQTQTIFKTRTQNGTVKAKYATDNPKPTIKAHATDHRKNNLAVQKTRYGLKCTFTHNNVDYHIQIQIQQT